MEVGGGYGYLMRDLLNSPGIKATMADPSVVDNLVAGRKSMI